MLPLADATPLRVTGALFKDLVFTFEQQNIPDGATILRTLRRNGAIIIDEVEDASIVLIDTELPSASDQLREANGKVVLHYSWVTKSLNAGYPLLEPSNWGDCRVTPENINNSFGYVPPPPSSNPQLQTPRPTPETRSYGFPTPSMFSQGSLGTTPPSSQPPYTPTPLHWSLEPAMSQPQTPQLPPANQVATYNPHFMQPPGTFSSFPVSQPAEGAMTYGQQTIWSPYQAQCGMTPEEIQRAFGLFMMLFRMPHMHQQLPPPPTQTQQSPAFHFSPPPPTQNPLSISGTHLGLTSMPGTPTESMVACRESTNFNNVPPGLGDPRGGQSPEPSTLLDLPPADLGSVPPPSLPGNTAGPFTVHTPLHTLPRLFEHDVGKPIKFSIPIIVKDRGKIAGIFRATGGGFTDDVEDADYVVLGQWEEHFFDETWYNARDCNKPTVTPAFVFDSYKNGRLMDPKDYPTRGPEKARKDEPKRTRPRPATSVRKKGGKKKRGAKFTSPQPTPSGEPPKWLRHFKEAEHTKSSQYIGAMFKKNPELTIDALAIHLHNKMDTHTIISWRRYCAYHKNIIEDLRQRAISNAEKKVIPKDSNMVDAFGAEATGETLMGANPQQADSPQVDPQDPNLQRANVQSLDPQQPAPEQTVPESTTPEQPISRPTICEQVAPPTATVQQTDPQTTTPQDMAPQQAIPQQATTQPITHQEPISPRESQPPPPPYEKAVQPRPVVVKAEPLDEDQLDFAFATEVLSAWKPNEESDAALWKRMETMRSSSTASSWEAFCEKHRSRFEHFFAGGSTPT